MLRRCGRHSIPHMVNRTFVQGRDHCSVTLTLFPPVTHHLHVPDVQTGVF